VIRAAFLIAATGCSIAPAAVDVEASVQPAATTSFEGRPAAAACGDAPLDPCPLQDWMDATLVPPFKRRDFGRLEAAFRDLAAMGPDGWSGWIEVADAGVAAARRGSIEDVRVACAGCHDRFRHRYRTEIRSRALPDGRGDR